MTLLATSSGLAAFLPFIFLVGCPLMMVFMMRGHGGNKAKPRERMSMDELKRERDELNGLIGDLAEKIVHARGTRRQAPR